MSDSQTFETERLLLRPHQPGDYDNCRALWTDTQVTRFIGGRPSTEEEAWARFLRFFGLWAVLGFGYWVVIEKATGAYVGEVGFGDFHREMEPPLGPDPEMGWVLFPGFQGKGYASEAVAGGLAWLEAQRGPCRTTCMIDEDNLPSQKVAARAGYREFARVDFKGKPVVLYQR
jgi:RimJ/RimL family protein N-acetyltransferase